MYRIPGAALRDMSLDAEELASQVSAVGPTGSSDGLISDAEGRVYISALEKDAILRTDAAGTEKGE